MHRLSMPQNFGPANNRELGLDVGSKLPRHSTKFRFSFCPRFRAFSFATKSCWLIDRLFDRLLSANLTGTELSSDASCPELLVWHQNIRFYSELQLLVIPHSRLFRMNKAATVIVYLKVNTAVCSGITTHTRARLKFGNDGGKYEMERLRLVHFWNPNTTIHLLHHQIQRGLKLRHDSLTLEQSTAIHPALCLSIFLPSSATENACL